MHVTGHRGGAAITGAVMVGVLVLSAGCDLTGGADPVVAPTETAISAPGSPSGELLLSRTAPGALAAPVPPTASGTAPATAAPDVGVLPAPAAGAPAPSTTKLAARLAPLLRASGLGDAVSLSVVDAAGGTTVASVRPDVVREPASTVKLFTGAAALATLGPQTRLPTTTRLPPGGDQVALVAGGDVLLAAGAGDPTRVNGHAGLADLAASTASALKAAGTMTVSVIVDDRLFSGPKVSPRWSPADVRAGYVAPITALEVDAGRVAKGVYAARSSDPTMTAAAAFARELQRRGIAVEGSPRRGAVAADAVEVARIESAPIGDLVEYTLTESDNTVAEALARLVAASNGAPATFDGGASAVLAEVRRLGIPTAGARLAGGSGLGDGTAISAASLTALLALAAGPDHPHLRPLLTGLPIAGVTGTLADRFTAASQQNVRGVVRAKTGSLTGVSALAGLVVDADGRLLIFALLADRTGASVPARRALDAVVTAIAECGCS